MALDIARPVTEPGHILVVDDDRVLNEFLSALLRLDHHSISQAHTVSAAFDILENKNVDLVLTDLMLPGETGIDLIARMKKSPRLAPIPTILISAIRETVDRSAVMDAGADDFLAKPLNKAELRARVNSLLRLKRTHDALQDSLAEKAAVLANFDKRVSDLKERHRSQLATTKQQVKAESVGVFVRYAEQRLREPLDHALGLANGPMSETDVTALRTDLSRIADALERLQADYKTALSLATPDAEA